MLTNSKADLLEQLVSHLSCVTMQWQATHKVLFTYMQVYGRGSNCHTYSMAHALLPKQNCLLGECRQLEFNRTKLRHFLMKLVFWWSCSFRAWRFGCWAIACGASRIHLERWRMDWFGRNRHVTTDIFCLQERERANRTHVIQLASF